VGADAGTSSIPGFSSVLDVLLFLCWTSLSLSLSEETASFSACRAILECGLRYPLFWTSSSWFFCASARCMVLLRLPCCVDLRMKGWKIRSTFGVNVRSYLIATCLSEDGTSVEHRHRGRLTVVQIHHSPVFRALHSDTPQLNKLHCENVSLAQRQSMPVKMPELELSESRESLD
jgi:hypothetical protein